MRLAPWTLIILGKHGSLRQRRRTKPASALTLPDPRAGSKVSAYMIRRVEGSEDHASDQHDAAVWITLSAVRGRVGWQPGPRLNLAPDHLCAVHRP